VMAQAATLCSTRATRVSGPNRRWEPTRRIWSIPVWTALRQSLIGTRNATDKIEAGAPQGINQILRTDAGEVQLCKPRQPSSTSNGNPKRCHNLGVSGVAARIGKEGWLLHG
jgi:hypothetical protein